MWLLDSGGIHVTVSELFSKAKRRTGHYEECGGTEIAYRRRSGLLLGVLLDSEDKWSLEGSNC